jgi:hypothetical protein
MYQVCTACRDTPCHLKFDVDDSGMLPEYCPFNVSLVPNWKETKKDLIVLPEDIERETKAIPCPECNGYCDEITIITMSKEEIKQYDCGKGYQCCSKAFECRHCHSRIIAKFEAPEIPLD